MRITLPDFAAGIIAVWFLVAVFVCPFIAAWHVLYPPKHRLHSDPHTSTPRKAGATYTHKSDLDGMRLANQDAAMRSQGMPPRKDLPIHPGMTDRRDGRLKDCSPLASPVDYCMRSVAASEVGSLQGESLERERQRTGVTTRRDGDFEDSSRSGLFALTWGGDPSQEMGRGGASLEGVPPQFLRPLLAASHLCSIDAPLLASLVQRESEWRADAMSTAGAIGLGQLMPRTAKAMRVDPWNPAQNLIGAACHLRAMLDRYKGDERRALIAYHRGAWAKGPTPQASHDYASDVIQGAN